MTRADNRWLKLLNEKYVADEVQGSEIISLLVQIHGCSDSQLGSVQSSLLNTLATNLKHQCSSYHTKVKKKISYTYINLGFGHRFRLHK